MSTPNPTMVVAAARFLCRRDSEACNVDYDDNWKTYGDEYLTDAREVLDAAGVPELVIALMGLVERGTDSPEHQAAEAALAKAIPSPTTEGTQ